MNISMTRGLVSDVTCLLVDDMKSVSVETVSDGDGTILRLRVASEDVGKLIGKQGRTARALRTLLWGIGIRQRHRYTLDIVVGG